MTITAISDISESVDYSANLNHSCDTMATATQMLTTGTYPDTGGLAHSIYPSGYPTLWPEIHYHYGTGLNPGAHAEKPHEVVQRALKEIAQAACALRDSAQAMGVPVDAVALEEAIVTRLREALAR